MVLEDLFCSFILWPNHPYFYLSTSVFTRPNNIKVWSVFDRSDLDICDCCVVKHCTYSVTPWAYDKTNTSAFVCVFPFFDPSPLVLLFCHFPCHPTWVPTLKPLSLLTIGPMCFARLWEISPIWAEKPPQLTQKMIGAEASGRLWRRLWSCWYFCDIFSSIWLFLLWMTCLHCCRSYARVSQVSTAMCVAFRCRLTTSL